MKIVLLFFSLSLLTSCQLTIYEDPIKSEQDILSGISSLEDFIIDEMYNYSVEKVSIAIICNNQLIYTNAFGASIDERLQAGSISKVVSSYCALKLIEQGEMALDEPLTKYILNPYIPNTCLGNKITLKMVLNHTSGLRNDASGKDRTIYHTPGTTFHYSGGGFAYLTYVIEQITGIPFDSYMESNILASVNMDNSVFSINDTGEKKVSAAYSLVTTPTDLAKFFIELMDPENINSELINQMLSASVQVNEHYSWGLGIGLQNGENEDAIWHWGNNNNLYHSFVVVYKESKTGVIIMTKGENGNKIYGDIAHEAIGADHYGYEKTILKW